VLRSEVIPQGDPEVPLPINLFRLTQKAQGLFPSSDNDDFGPVEVITGVKALLDKLIVVPGKDGLSEEAQRNATVLLFAHIRSTLASKPVRPLTKHCLLCTAVQVFENGGHQQHSACA
jgi:DNA-directed RNA polymerase II subunit RPB1